MVVIVAGEEIQGAEGLASDGDLDKTSELSTSGSGAVLKTHDATLSRSVARNSSLATIDFHPS